VLVRIIFVDIIGIFEVRNMAESAAKGRGNLDCGGDGKIEERKGVRDGDKVYLLELDYPIKCNMVVNKDPRNEKYTYGIMVTEVTNPISFMRIVRRRTEMGLKEVKDLYDNVKANGKFPIKNMPNNINEIFTKEEFGEWKQELLGIATIEAI
jgi:ribosomal protein L7/L12